MKKILFTLGLASFLISCSTIVKEESDLYKNYKPKYSFGENKTEDSKDSKELLLGKNLENEKILNDENLANIAFDRSVRKVNKNLKGVWVATVLNLDFPKTSSVFEQQREIDNIMENVKSWGLNAVFFHVRPAADAFFESEYEPWSIYLTGTQNQYPGYDPLAYAVEAAHKRGLELHAWINPYRASMNTDLSKISSKSVIAKHPDWIFEYDGKYFMNPGNPEVVKYVSTVIEEIVEKYDIDGLHLDDYFYPYPSGKYSLGENIDDKEYEKYGQNFTNKGDWRRDNVNNMIKNLSVSVHKIKPRLSFGVSPFGIWRNQRSDINGSLTSGLESYDTLYADSLKWMREGWVDYIAPQVYWNIGFQAADYETLAKWWSEKAIETNTPLYIGQGVYKVNEWKDKQETAKQLRLNNSLSGVNGSIFFRYETLLNNSDLVKQIKENMK